MENTGKVLFEDENSANWYVALGDRWLGPMAATDIYEKILSQEISWAHFVWKQGMPDWKRICDIPVFQAAVPGRPAKQVQAEVKAAAVPVVRKAQKAASTPPPKPAGQKVRTWFLYYNSSQFGPFYIDEIKNFLSIGKIHGKVHAWKEGMADWTKIENIEDFKGIKSAKKTPPSGPGKKLKPVLRQEHRSSPRRPLVAKIIVADEKSVVSGICRDVSVGGMQVLTDTVPGKVGGKLKLNVSPAGDMTGGAIKPFVAEGVIVRLLDDGRGFSFRFEKLPEVARKAIEEYLDA